MRPEAVLPNALVDALVELFARPPRNPMMLGGGDISRTARVTVGGIPYVVKWSAQPLNAPAGWPDVFDAEAAGLRLLAAARAIRVPEVVACVVGRPNCPSFLVLEWIESSSSADPRSAGRLLGAQLALQHRATAEAYGLDHHNYCGATPQPNEWRTSWVEFYRRQRLDVQMQLAIANGRMPSRRRERLERLLSRLDEWIDESSVQPSLLHGDLWEGNWLVASDGTPAVIDPAAYFGDREAELAMCRLFGGFPAEFFSAYDDAWPPAPGRDERVPLYQLYHLLNHLNLFGESYGRRVDAILQHYLG